MISAMSLLTCSSAIYLLWGNVYSALCQFLIVQPILKMYLNDQKKERKQSSTLCWFTLLNNSKGRAWARRKPGTRNSLSLLQEWQDSVLPSVVLECTLAESCHWKHSWDLIPVTLKWDVDIPSNVLTACPCPLFN